MTSDNPGQPSARWRKYVNERPIVSLLLIGVIATQLGTYFGYVFPAFGLPQLPWPAYNGYLAGVFDSPTGNFFVGNALHFVNGIVFAILYGVLFREDVKFLKNTRSGNLQKGALYAVILTIISVGVLVPYAYVPKQGYGLFSFEGPDGWKLPFANLIWHMIYGLTLGLLYQPEDDGK